MAFSRPMQAESLEFVRAGCETGVEGVCKKTPISGIFSLCENFKLLGSSEIAPRGVIFPIDRHASCSSSG